MADAMNPSLPSEDGLRAARPLAPTRPLYWSIRRELWENRSIWIAPFVAAGVLLVGFVILLTRLPQRFPTPHGHAAADLPPPETPYGFVAVVILAAALITGVFYCLGALGSERRDRSILFWKSLPVSDTVTVASKLLVPMAILPAVTFAAIAATQLAVFAMLSIAAAGGSAIASYFTAHVGLPVMLLDLLYAVVVAMIWYAPVWAWCLLVGGWARRVAFLWAGGVPLALIVIEQIAFGTSYVGRLVAGRLGGGFDAAFDTPPHPKGVMPQPHPDIVGLLSSPGLWGGLAVAAVLIAAAVWMRRYRDPI